MNEKIHIHTKNCLVFQIQKPEQERYVRQIFFNRTDLLAPILPPKTRPSPVKLNPIDQIKWSSKGIRMKSQPPCMNRVHIINISKYTQEKE